MKKLLMVAGVFLSAITFSFAGSNYTLDEAVVDNAFAQSEDVTEVIFTSAADVSLMNFGAAAPTQESVGGFLLRSFFCGIIGLHRSYMGAENIWWKYCLVSFVPFGGFINCIDFAYVLFKGQDALAKYRNNDKLIVWAGNN